MANRLTLLLLMWAPGMGWACSCGFKAVCGSLPDPSNQQQAVFVGTVREFYPKSRQEMDQLRWEFWNAHPELHPQSGGAGIQAAGRRLANAADAPGDQDFRKQFIRSVWGDSLTPAEEEQLRNANGRELDRLRLDYRRRARFNVLEIFSHADSSEFELFTSLDGPSCGFDFVEGATYLVRAYRSAPDQPWQVGSCTAPKLVTSAADDLDALRSWKAGIPPKARIIGEVFSRNIPASGNVTLQLLGGNHIYETTAAAGGQFEFQDLDPGSYRLVWSGMSSEPRSIDLTHAWCARVLVPLDRR